MTDSNADRQKEAGGSASETPTRALSPSLNDKKAASIDGLDATVALSADAGPAHHDPGHVPALDATLSMTVADLPATAGPGDIGPTISPSPRIGDADASPTTALLDGAGSLSEDAKRRREEPPTVATVYHGDPPRIGENDRTVVADFVISAPASARGPDTGDVWTAPGSPTASLDARHLTAATSATDAARPRQTSDLTAQTGSAAAPHRPAGMPERIAQFTLLEKLGAGGMGAVYLGRDDKTGLLAAIKVLPASLSREEGFVERFGREVDAMKKLDSPHIVKLYEQGVDNETYYYVMEYVAGETLLGLLRRERRLSPDRTIDFTLQICQALKAAHDAGIVHRDLKPSNLLVTLDGTIKLTDFGVAQVFAGDRLTVTGGIIGTAEYMSPEQAQGKRASKQSDLYSLGAVMYVMVTGRPPFSGNTAIDVIQKHKFGQFDRPRLINENVPPWLEAIICQLLEKDPAKRFPDAFVLMRKLMQEQAAARLREAGEEPDDTEVISRKKSRSGRSGPGPATMMKHLVRAELEESQATHPWLEVFNNTWVLAGLLIGLLLILGTVMFRGTELTPDQKFAAGVALLEQEPSLEWLRARKEFFEPLLAHDSAAWDDKVAPYLSKIRLYEMTRKRGGGSASDEPESEAERFLLLARHYQQTGDLPRAERTLRALLDATTGDESQRKFRDVARQWLDNLDPQKLARRKAYLTDGLARARKLIASEQIPEATRLLDALLHLYDDDPPLADLLSEARTLRASLDK